MPHRSFSFFSVLAFLALVLTSFPSAAGASTPILTQDSALRDGLPATVAASVAAPISRPLPGQPAFAPGRLLVKFRPGAEPNAGLDGLLRTGQPALDRLLVGQGVLNAGPLLHLSPALQVTDLGQAVADAGLTRVYKLALAPGSDVLKAAEVLTTDPSVEYAEPDYLAYAADTIPNDPFFPGQWALAKVEAPAAWDVITGTPTVVIAVLDTGIDLDHPDLTGRLWANPGETPGNGLDDDGNGYVDDVRGWNFVADTNEVNDDDGHGTRVAGATVAQTNNGAGVAGVCWNCRVMPVKVMQAGGVANYSDVALGVIYAATKGAEVIDLSLGGYADSNTLRQAIEAAADTSVIVGAAGDDHTSSAFYPAAYPDVLAVGGTTATDGRASFSNYGDWVDVAAPAVAITTTLNGGTYGPASGTSLSAPLASGLAGLVWSQHPTWSAALVRAQVLHTTDPLSDPQLGTGRLNAWRAVTQTPHPLLSITSTAVDGDPLGRPIPGQQATLGMTLGNDWLDATGVTGELSTADPYVTVLTGTAAFGAIPAGGTATGSPAYAFNVAADAGYNHPIPFALDLAANGGAYTVTLPLTITTQSANQNVGGTIITHTTWTNDKTYIVTNNVGVAPGITLTVQPGTQIRFNGNYSLNVGGTLIADGTEAQPIRFMHHTGGSWGRIYFDDPSMDATADISGTYQGGNILHWVWVEDAAQGIGCNDATPFLAHINTNSGGINCTLGTNLMWLTNGDLLGDISIMYGEDSPGLSGKWTTKASMPTARRLLGAATASNGRIYAIGGRDDSYLAAVEEYDSTTDTWLTKLNMPTARWGLGAAATSEGKIYAIGGTVDDTHGLATVEEYNVISNTWRTRADMPTARLLLGAVTATNDKIYAIGGYIEGGIPVSVVEEYDPEANTWTRRADIPTPRYNLGVVASSNGKIYAVGGQAGDGTTLNTVEEYDPATNTWVTRASMPTGRYGLGVVAADNGKIYAIGGMGTGVVEEYDPTTDTWTSRASMPAWRYGLGAAAQNGKVYAIGGWNGQHLNQVEEFTLPLTPFPLRVHNTTSHDGNLSLPNGSQVLNSAIDGSISVGSDSAVQNSLAGGGINISGSGRVAESTAGGTVSLGNGMVQGTTVSSGGISIGSGTVLSNTVQSGGISAGAGSVVRGNDVENSPGWAIHGSGTVTATANRVVGNANGIQVSGGLLQNNLIANSAGVGLQVSGNTDVLSNTLAGNEGNTIVIVSGMPAIHGNNLELNHGDYDLVNNTPNPVDASRNWWGTIDSTVVEERVYDFMDDFGLGRVSYTPMLTEPTQGAPAYIRAITLTPEGPIGIESVKFDVLFSREMDEGHQPDVSFFDARRGTTASYSTGMDGWSDGRTLAVHGDTVYAGSSSYVWSGGTCNAHGGSGLGMFKDGVWQVLDPYRSVTAVAVDMFGNRFLAGVDYNCRGNIEVWKADGSWQSYPPPVQHWINAIWFDTGGYAYVEWDFMPTSPITYVLSPDGNWLPYTGQPYSGAWWSLPYSQTSDQYGNMWSMQWSPTQEWFLRVHYYGLDYLATEYARWWSPTHYYAMYDISSLVPRGVYSVSVQHALGMDAIAIAPNLNYTFTVDYIGSADTRTPPRPVVRACASDSAVSLSAEWTIPTTQTIGLYRYAVGTSPGGHDVTNWVTTTLTSIVRDNLNLLPGQTYYVSVKARSTGGIWSDAGVSNGVVAGAGGCPQVDFTGSPITGMSPLQVTFASQVTGTATSYLWSFGNGITDTLPKPVYAYWVPGVYTVTLDVFGPGGWTTVVKDSYITLVPDTVPPSGTLTVASGAAYVPVFTVTLDITSGDPSGLSEMRLSNDGASYSAWIPYTGSYSWTLLTGDGLKTVYAQIKDVPGNVATFTDTVTLDTTPPAASTSALPPFVGASAFTVTWAGNDLYAGLDSFDVQARAGAGAWTDWLTDTMQTAVQFTGEHDQTYYFRARARDVLGNLGAYAPGDGDTHTTVDLLPPTGSLLLNSGATYANSLEVTLDLTATDLSGLAAFQASNDGLSYSEWLSYTTAYSWTLAPGDEMKTVYARFRDLVGHESEPVTDTILLHTEPPTGTLLIAEGVWATPSASVSLTITASDGLGVADMCLANDDEPCGSWEPFVPSRPWVLRLVDGTRTVQAQVRDLAGNTTVLTDSILLDTTPPETTAAPAGVPGSHGWWRSPVQVSLTAVDATSGVDETRYRTDGGSWLVYTIPFSLSPDGLHMVDYASVDLVGNQEVFHSLDVPIDTAPPTTTASLSGTPGNGGWYVSDAQVSLVAADATSGVDTTSYRVDGGAWQPYTAPITVSDGIHIVDYRSLDLAGNEEAVQGVTVQVDSVPPIAAVNPLTPYQTHLTFTVSWAGDDPLSGAASFDVQARDGDSPWTDWLSATTALSATFTGLDGHVFSFRARARDGAGNVGEYAPSDDVSTHVDTTRPEGEIGINGVATDTTSRDVILVLLANGESQMAFSQDGQQFGAWEPFAPTRAYQLPAGDGLKTLWVRYCCDLAGHTRDYSDTITLNSSVPGDVGLTINDDAPLTDQVTVTLTLKAPPATRDMMISNSSRFVAAEWEPYSITRTWVLAYYPGVEVYQVYARFRSVDGGVGERYDDIITLHLDEPPPPIDSTPPNGSVVIDAGAGQTSDPDVVLDVLAADNPGGVGVQWVYFREWKYDPVVVQWVPVRNSGWLPYADSSPWALAEGTGVKYVGAWFADGANNVSNPVVVDDIDLIMPGDLISETEVTQYRRSFEVGETVTATLVVTGGDADLYIWRPGSIAYPDYWSNLPGPATEQLVFTAVEGEYLIEVHGYASSVCTLEIDTSGVGGGGPRKAQGLPIMPGTLASAKPLPPHPLVVTQPGQVDWPVEPKRRIYLPIILRQH